MPIDHVGPAIEVIAGLPKQQDRLQLPKASRMSVGYFLTPDTIEFTPSESSVEESSGKQRMGGKTKSIDRVLGSDQSHERAFEYFRKSENI